MRTVWLYLLLLSLTLGASKSFYLGLFGTVVNLPENDTLSVRKKPDYRSKQVAQLPIDAFVGVEECQHVGKSTWCKVHHLSQYDYEEFGWDAPPGWVNAKYLSFGNQGYVIIDKHPNCDYALRCLDDECEVAIDSKEDTSYNIVSLTIKKIARNRLYAASHFDAMEENGEGYCIFGRKVEEYLRKKRTKKLLRDESNNIKKRLLGIVDALQELQATGNTEALLPYVHPLKGVTMNWGTRFLGYSNKNFSYTQIKTLNKHRYQTIYWGSTGGNNMAVHKSLLGYMQMLSQPVSDITKIEKLKDLKGFSSGVKEQCRSYEVFWLAEQKKSNDWLGLVVIFEKYKGKWYIVGLLRDRWTI